GRRRQRAARDQAGSGRLYWRRRPPPRRCRDRRLKYYFNRFGSLTGPGPPPKNRALFGPYRAFSEPETHEAHLSAEQTRAQAPPWLPFAHGHRWRPQGAEPPPQQRPQEAFGLNAPVPLVVDHLKKRADFLRAARGIRRVEGAITLETCPTPEPEALQGRLRVG